MSQIQRSFDGESLITPSLLAEQTANQSDVSLDDQYVTAELQAFLVLNIAQQRFQSGQRAPANILDRLSHDLHKMRLMLKPAVWKRLVPFIQNHPVAEFVHQDPFTHWSFRKPRGYSGDAHLLDFIYAHADASAEVEASTALGLALYEHCAGSAAVEAVRERRNILADFVDDVAATKGGEAEIFTIAAGHLREAELSKTMQEGKIKRWVALDQDPMSIATIEGRLGGTCVEALNGSVRGILRNEYALGSFDAIYAAGLYDYLPRDVSIKLSAKCLQLLKPGGVFLFANFHIDIAEDAFMETFMNWELLLRSEREVWDIIDSIQNPGIAETSVFFGKNRNIAYGVVKMK